MFERLWVRIPALYIGWTFFTLICCKKNYCFFEKTENKRKRGRGWPIFKLSFNFANSLSGKKPRIKNPFVMAGALQTILLTSFSHQTYVVGNFIKHLNKTLGQLDRSHLVKRHFGHTKHTYL